VRFNGLYNGKGGEWYGSTAEASNCENFWTFNKNDGSNNFPTQSASCSAFKKSFSCSAADWAGAYLDVFTTDGTCASNSRSILQIGSVLASGHQGCDGAQGFVYDSMHAPLIRLSSDSCTAKVSYRDEFPDSSPFYSLAQSHALDFTITLGSIDDWKVIMWNGPYDGVGGPWLDGSSVGPAGCNNFWSATSNGSPLQVFDTSAKACDAFKPVSNCEGAWQGAYFDAYSPEGSCPQGHRYIMMKNGQLTMQHTGCHTIDGYNATTSIPLSAIGQDTIGCQAAVSFKNAYPASSQMYDLAQKGAFNFTLTLGMLGGAKVVRWSGLYNGAGGDWMNGVQAPAKSCDNMWVAASLATSDSM